MSIVNVDYYRQQSKQLEIILTVNNINSILTLQLIVMHLTVLEERMPMILGIGLMPELLDLQVSLLFGGSN